MILNFSILKENVHPGKPMPKETLQQTPNLETWNVLLQADIYTDLLKKNLQVEVCSNYEDRKTCI